MPALILIVDDEQPFRDLYANTLKSAGFKTSTAGSSEEAEKLIEQEKPDMVISDVKLPGASGLDLLKKIRSPENNIPFLLVTAYADVRDAVKALKLGAVDYLSKPVDLNELVASVEDALGKPETKQENTLPPSAMKNIVAESPAMKSILKDAFMIAGSDATTLITGESGTGKEVLARFIHDNSGRAKKSFVALNCSAIAPTLLASELFGHEKGAFTGAVSSRKGRFREADGGTLFLDEIGDMPTDLQSSLLRAIETKSVSPVGSDKEEKSDFRLIVATNRNLREAMTHGGFREDLFYRLNVIALDIPPLRERPEDILPLARLMLKTGEENKRLSNTAEHLLKDYPWPGNVRELTNAIERARLLSPAEIILPEHLPPAIVKNLPKNTSGTPEKVQTIDNAERKAIENALAQTGGNRTKAADLLGISRRNLIYKLKRYGTHS